MTTLRSPGVKMLGLGLLALLLLIPIGLVQNLVGERQQRAAEAEASIAAQWGTSQAFAAAYLVADVPVEMAHGSGFVVRPKPHVLLPDTIDVDGTITTEIRKRGMFEVPVYTTALSVKARFAPEDIAALRAKRAVDSPLRIRFAIDDPRGVREVSLLRVGGVELRPVAIGAELGGLRALGADVSDNALDDDGGLSVTYKATIAGVRLFEVLALARTTSAHLAGAWPDPNFTGAFLPAERTITPEGFDARWQVLEFNRELPQTFPLDHLGSGLETASGFDARMQRAPAFGVDLFQPNDVYQQNERSAKYGVLVVALMFMALFLFEIIGGVALHAIQYLLVGLALATFYLLLLAVSEHVGFSPAYGLAALASALVVTGYARAVLRSMQRAVLLGGLQGGAYAVFFVLVQNDDYALLLGAVTLFGVLALIMYLTRNTDWFALGRPLPEPAAG